MKRRRILGLLGSVLITCSGAFAGDSGLQKQTEYGVGVRAGSSLLQYHDTCVFFRPYFVSGQFFAGMKRTVKLGATEFAKGEKTYRDFPIPLTVDVEARVFRCGGKIGHIDPPDYASGLMKGASFEVSWRSVAGNRSVSLPPPVEKHEDREYDWDYFLQVPADGVPLTETLVINVVLRQGVANIRFEANLAGPYGLPLTKPGRGL